MDIDSTIEDWKRRVDEKTKNIENDLDQGLLKAALFCEGKAKQNAMDRIYNTPIPTYKNGRPRYKRTGLYKASIASGMSPDKKHSSIIYNSAPYAKYLEYGTSKGIRGKNIMGDAVFQNKEDIGKIIANYMKNSVK